MEKSRIATLQAVLLLGLALGAPVPAQEAVAETEPGILALVTRGTWAALAVSDGRVVVIDVATGRRFEWSAPEGSVESLAIAFPEAGSGAGEASALPGILMTTGGTKEGAGLLFGLDAADGTTLHRAALDRLPSFLLAGTGLEVGYMLTDSGGNRWLLDAVTLETGDRATVELSGPVLGAAISPYGDRIYAAVPDQIRTFSTRPVRSSWMVRSPGVNRAVAPFLSGQFLVLRDSQIVLFDPDDLPGRDPVSGLFPDDAAMAGLDLPFEPRALSLSFDGRDVAVLDREGRRLALVDVEDRQVREARDLQGVAAVIFHPERPSLFLLGNDGDLGEMRFTPLPGQPPPRQVASAPPPPPPRRAPEIVAPPARPAAAPATGDRSPEPEPEDVEPPPESPADERQERIEEVEISGGPFPYGESPRPSEPALAPDHLSGRIRGEAELVEAVALYGPDSIFKEHARARPASDGSFSFPLPPPGRYRLLVIGVKGTQLNLTPPFRQLTVEEGGTEGLDFSVRGKIEGRLRP